MVGKSAGLAPGAVPRGGISPGSPLGAGREGWSEECERDGPAGRLGKHRGDYQPSMEMG